MSQDLSNLYVEKVNSEHPLAVWMLNEDIDYLSLITEEQRYFEDNLIWSITNGSAEEDINPEADTPILTSHVSVISGDIPSDPTMDIFAESIFNIDLNSFNETLANFAIGLHIYVNTPYANSITYGYRYFNSLTLVYEEVSETQTLSSLDLNSWKFYSQTLDNPPAEASLMTLFIRINVSEGGGLNDYNFKINGLSIGHWSEEFNRKSIGLNPTPISEDIAVFGAAADVVTAYPYGGSSLNGYYISHDYRSYALNFGIPLVYGSKHSTKLYSHSHTEEDVTTYFPSLIFPGYGFLNQKGKFNEYTAEMWVRLNTDANVPRKFFGPIASNDGLYVESGFITLVIGNKYGSHYVGEWFRPMLIQIRLIQNNASVILNGEEIINITYIDNDLNLASEYNEENKNQDWLGFYSYEDVTPVTIDSFAIYPYSVPVEVAKRRWVWGQAVVAPETTNASLNATTVFTDYGYANYASNYNYPDFATWKQGFFSNMSTTSNFLQLPEYELPDFTLGSKTLEEWKNSLKSQQVSTSNKYFTFRPNSSWNTDTCYMYFKTLNILNEKTDCFYCIFETDGSATNQPLFKIQNNITKDYLLAKISGSTITYLLSISGNVSTISQVNISTNTPFVAGINIPILSLQDISGINQFITNQSSLIVLVGGDTESTFTGKIYKIGFDASYNSRKLSSAISSNGILVPDDEIFDTHTSNYTLIALEKYNLFFPDIAVSGYWEDYVPLSYFAKYVENYDGDKFYDLDSIQLNLDYPEPIDNNAVESVSTWTYEDLDNRYDSPTQLQYAQLDNNIYSGWEDYGDLDQDSEKYFYYSTEGNTLKSYISFQYINDGANKNLVDFETLQVPRTTGVVDPTFLGNQWTSTAYEVVDGTIIYPPVLTPEENTLDFNNLAVVSHLDFTSDGILHHPVRFRELQLASQVLERKQFTEIGTKFGVPVYPYSKTGFYYDFKGKNPVSIYKGSTPYLYLNRHSGFRMRGEYSPLLDRGIAIPVNQQKGLNTKISAIQMWIRFGDRAMPTGDTPIFTIDHKNNIYDFYLVGDSSLQRGKIYGKNRSTGAVLTNVEYHVNGDFVDTPYIVNQEWTSIGIAFTELLDFSQYTGRINLNGPLTYNNISYYLATNLEQTQRVQVRTWGQVKENPTSIIWDYWQNSFTWTQVNIISSSNFYSIDPSVIYDKYVGSSRIVVDDSTDGIWIRPEQFKIYNEMLWSSSTQIAV